MANCNNDCAACNADCKDRKPQKKAPHPKSKIGRVIAVASGKGGVGKSLVTSLLAVRARAMGYRVAILDADITGPSIPRAFGVHDLATGTDGEIYPVTSASGIKMISMNNLLEHEDDPVVWRGALIAGAAMQFWTDVVWDETDIMFIDMPPGTGDVPLSVYQSLPLDGIVFVSTPQELVEMIVKKAVNMAGLLQVPILGLVENMSYFTCPDCGKRHALFGESKADALAQKYGIPATARLPIDPALAALVDGGKIEEANTDGVGEVFRQISFGKK